MRKIKNEDKMSMILLIDKIDRIALICLNYLIVLGSRYMNEHCTYGKCMWNVVYNIMYLQYIVHIHSSYIDILGVYVKLSYTIINYMNLDYIRFSCFYT